MKLIQATFGPFERNEVIGALRDAGASGATIEEIWDARPRAIALRVRIEVVVHDDLVERTVEAIRRAARAGSPTDGAILIAPVLEALRIHTGEIDEAAIA